MTTKSLYEKYCDGDSLTDAEVSDGIVKFEAAERALLALGPCFSVARKECSRVYQYFKNFADARSQKAVQASGYDDISDCGTCGNYYLAIRTDLYKDKRPFVYCDCCGSMGDLKLWNRANAKPENPPA